MEQVSFLRVYYSLYVIFSSQLESLSISLKSREPLGGLAVASAALWLCLPARSELLRITQKGLEIDYFKRSRNKLTVS